MILPFVKLGTLALKTFAKPIASRLKKELGYTPSFRLLLAAEEVRYGGSVHMVRFLSGGLFFGVAGAAVIFEVQRSSRSEARKEEQQAGGIGGTLI
ncbi:hypothetical protein Syun_008698 [Stephania yunnanensis]|uniref:Uncharacterized protein n=1 Tax=Stephania yunnanensis TaxID=152371 RepID=A0AAP0KF81_9MAGN